MRLFSDLEDQYDNHGRLLEMANESPGVYSGFIAGTLQLRANGSMAGSPSDQLCYYSFVLSKTSRIDSVAIRDKVDMFHKYVATKAAKLRFCDISVQI
jgi:hypothetical protein